MQRYKTHYAKVNPNKLTDEHKKALGNDLKGDKVRCSNEATKKHFGTSQVKIEMERITVNVTASITK